MCPLICMTLCVTVTNAVLGSMSDHQPIFLSYLTKPACYSYSNKPLDSLLIYQWISQEYCALHRVELCRTVSDLMDFDKDECYLRKSSQRFCICSGQCMTKKKLVTMQHNLKISPSLKYTSAFCVENANTFAENHRVIF